MNNIKILHITDDEKFMDAAYYLYEKAFPKSNYVIVTIPDKEFYNLKYKSNNKYEILKKNFKNLKNLKKIIDEYDIVIFHSFDDFKAELVNKKNLKKIIYTVWGGEIYRNHYKFHYNNFEKKTLEYINKNNSIPNLILKPYIFYIKGLLQNVLSKKYLKLKKIRYVSVLHEEELKLFKKKGVINKNAKYLIFTYYPVEFIFKNNKNLTITANNILIGNSATPSNNHLDIFEKIKKLNIKNRQIILPLNYGDKKYGKYIAKQAQKYFKNTKPLFDFLPLNEYNKILQSCDILVMNHIRQQATGNILTGLWLGAKVFLNKKNTLYHYLKRKGCIIYSIDELNDQTINSPLSNEKINKNREILMQEIGEQKIINEIKKELYQIIISKNEY